MNSKALSNNNAPTESAIKASSGEADLHEKSFLELMDSIPSSGNIEFDPPKLNFTFKSIEFD
jgi:hypothetical protein